MLCWGVWLYDLIQNNNINNDKNDNSMNIAWGDGGER